jgi:2-keto-4-pentenoate hydratase
MSAAKLDHAATDERLIGAHDAHIPIPPLVESHDLTIPDAYRIRRIARTRKLETGCRVVGRKVGLTRRAMQELPLRFRSRRAIFRRPPTGP